MKGSSLVRARPSVLKGELVGENRRKEARLFEMQ